MTGPRELGARHFVTSTAASYLTLGSSIVGGFVTLPIGVEYFGLAKYGAWLVAVSLAAYAAVGALGMPLATLTAVGQTVDEEDAARVAAQAIRFVFWGAVATATVGAIGWAIAPVWPTLILGSIGRSTEITVALAILLGGALAYLPFATLGAVLVGRHHIVARNVYEMTRIVLRIGALLATVATGGNLITLALFTVGADVFSGLAVLVHVVAGERLAVWRYLGARGRPGLVASALRFLALQVAVLVIRNTDNLVISAIIGTAAVAAYVAPIRVILGASSLIQAIQGPLWPAYGDAFRRKDWEWIRTAHRRVTSVGLALGGLVWVGSAGLLPWAIGVWLGNDFPVDRGVIFTLGAYGFVFSFVNANAILLNALDATKSQVISGAVDAAINLGVSIVLARHLGIAGVAIGTLVGAVAMSFWYLPFDVRRKTQGRVWPSLRPAFLAIAYTVPLAFIAHVAAPERLISGGTLMVAASVGMYLVIALGQYRKDIWGHPRQRRVNDDH